MFLLKKEHRRIVYFKAQVQLRSEASKTYLSILWWIMEPAFLMAIYYFVFAVLLERRTGEFTVFLLIGLLSWQWFAACIGAGMNSVDGGRQMISQLKFPKIILPSVIILIDTFKFGIVFLILCIFIWIYGIPPSWAYLALVPVLFAQYVFISATTYLAALAPAFLPDLKILINLVLRAGLFLSGVFYDFRTFDEELQKFFVVNPMALIMEMYRNILIYGRFPDAQTLGILLLVSLGLLLLARALFSRFDPVLPRLLAER